MYVNERKDTMEHYMNEEMIEMFRKSMIMNERAKATIEKYIRDLRMFYNALDEQRTVSKEIVIEFKQRLLETYSPVSVNSMLAALNSFFKEMGWYECVVKTVKIQRDNFRLTEREMSRQEYHTLLESANKRKNQRLFYILQTLGATGIRISELKFITVESLNTQRAYVHLKGKARTVVLPKDLCEHLKNYIRQQKITEGPIFVSRNGKPLDRSNICHDMKKLSRETGISREKLFPHNLRHMFACVYYHEIKDLPRLADVLGHSNVNTTRIYTRVSCETQLRDMELLHLTL